MPRVRIPQVDGRPELLVCGRSTAGVVRLPEWPAINSSPMSVKGVEALGAANMVTGACSRSTTMPLSMARLRSVPKATRCVRTGDPPGAQGCHCCGHRPHDYRRHDLGKRGRAGEDGRYPIVLSFSLEAEITGPGGRTSRVSRHKTVTPGRQVPKIASRQRHFTRRGRHARAWPGEPCLATAMLSCKILRRHQHPRGSSLRS